MRLDESGLLAAMHEGMFEQPLWHGFLERLRARTRADYVGLMLNADDGRPFLWLEAGTRPGLLDRICRSAAGDRAAAHDLRDMRVYTETELAALAGNPAPAAFAPAALTRPAARDDAATLRIVKVTEPGGTHAWLTCASNGDIPVSIAALLTALAPHLRIAVRAFVAYDREKNKSSVTSAALGRLSTGWLTLDARCRIIDMTVELEPLFQRCDVLRRGRYNRLVPISPAIDREVTALVRSFAEKGGGRSRAINLSRDPLIDMLVKPTQNEPCGLQSTPVAIVHISGDKFSQANRCEQLSDLFGLLPSESRLAWAITQGMSISEAASSLGLSVDTARTYSKQIYVKMNVSGQVGMVRQILRSLPALS